MNRFFTPSRFTYFDQFESSFEHTYRRHTQPVCDSLHLPTRTHMLELFPHPPQSHSFSKVYSTRKTNKKFRAVRAELKMPMNEHTTNFSLLLFHCRQSVTVCLFNCRYDCIPRYVSNPDFLFIFILFFFNFHRNVVSIHENCSINISLRNIFPIEYKIELQKHSATKFSAITRCHRNRRVSSTMK